MKLRNYALITVAVLVLAIAGEVTKQVWDARVRSTGSVVSSLGGVIKLV
jgi:hypothetical protein